MSDFEMYEALDKLGDARRKIAALTAENAKLARELKLARKVVEDSRRFKGFATPLDRSLAAYDSREPG